ncbi:MAG: hypothetical protein QOE61_2367, partial [Micromonosporaceae bacterium]|nr:hypothetical protein [Micromonosporaceae bacterium]
MQATSAQSGLPRRVQPLYRSSDDGAIIVYAGDLELSKDGTTWRASGDLELRLSP